MAINYAGQGLHAEPDEKEVLARRYQLDPNRDLYENRRRYIQRLLYRRLNREGFYPIYLTDAIHASAAKFPH